MNGKVKFRDAAEIRRTAEGFRSSALLRGHETPPIDVIYIAEVLLKLDVIPITALFAEEHIDAALLPDLSGVYIDEEAYMNWEKGVRWIEQRLRFSFAHELGHYVLHKQEIKAQQFKDVAAFRRWAANRAEYEGAEYQADEFAGRFLVPLDVLLREYDQQCRKLSSSDARWREKEGTRNAIARKIAPRFGVNFQVIEVRLDREGIWPVE